MLWAPLPTTIGSPAALEDMGEATQQLVAANKNPTVREGAMLGTVRCASLNASDWAMCALSTAQGVLHCVF